MDAGNEFERTNVQMYDFHARWYDQQTGRFGGQDPLAENNYSVSPYTYCDGDPINFTDPWGLKKGDPDDPFGPNDYGPYDIDFEPSVTESPGKNKKKGYGGGGGGSFGGGGAGGYFGDFDNPFITQNPALSALYEKEYAERERLRQEMMKLQRIEEGLKANRDLLGPIVAGMAYVSMLAENTEVETIPIHGNSLRSLRPTWGYKLYSKDGTFLKNGITSKVIPETRYTKSFMNDKYMDKFPFPNRAAAYQWEFEQNQILRGPLNLNMH